MMGIDKNTTQPGNANHNIYIYIFKSFYGYWPGREGDESICASFHCLREKIERGKISHFTEWKMENGAHSPKRWKNYYLYYIRYLLSMQNQNKLPLSVLFPLSFCLCHTGDSLRIGQKPNCDSSNCQHGRFSRIFTTIVGHIALHDCYELRLIRNLSKCTH